MEKSYDEFAPIVNEKTIKKEGSTESYFDGKFLEYIGYKLLAGIITLVSFTIAKPWADKLILEYKINHTIYNGKRLRFEGKGSSLFVQRFKWFFLSIITLGIYSFWIPIKMEKWTISNVHFEDEDFKNGESYFDGGLLGLIGVNLFAYLLTLMSLGLLLPFAICYRQKWIAKHTVINCKKIVFDGKALSLIGHYLLWYLLSIITFGIYGIWLPMKVYGWNVKNTHLKLKDEQYEKESKLPLIVGIILAILLVIVLVKIVPKTDIPKLISGDKSIQDIFKKESSNIQNQEKSYIKGIDSDLSNGFVVYIKNGKGTLVKTYTDSIKIADLEIPTKDGYQFVGWTDENGKDLSNSYVISDSITVIPKWKENTTTETETPTASSTTSTNKTTKCDDGWVYQYGKCFKLDDWVDAIDISGGEGDSAYNGIGCPDGYEPAGYENGFDGACHITKEPNF